MNRITASIGLTAMTALLIGLAGCNTGGSDKAAAPLAGQSKVDSNEHTEHDHSTADLEKLKAALAKLSPEDRATAEKQHLCPVTSEVLGTMGTPTKVDVNGQQVWICCDGCREELLTDPDKYLAKLNKR